MVTEDQRSDLKAKLQIVEVGLNFNQKAALDGLKESLYVLCGFRPLSDDEVDAFDCLAKTINDDQYFRGLPPNIKEHVAEQFLDLFPRRVLSMYHEIKRY